MSNHFRYITPVAPKLAQGDLAMVYQQFRQELGLIPEPLTLHAPAPTLMVGLWGVFRTSLLVGTASRGAKEAVAAAISDLNRCPWCVDAHTIMLYGTQNQDTAQVILGGHTRSQLPQDMRALLDWGYATRTPEASILTHPPFSAEQAGEFLGTVLLFQYLNRMVSIFLSETFMPTAPWMRSVVRRLAGRKLGRAARQTFAASESRGASSLPAELHWMSQWPTIAQAFSVWESIVEDLGTQALPTPVRELLDSIVGAWDGSDPGLSRHWAEDAIAPLTAAHRPIGRVALLAALAPYQMDASTMQEYLDLQPDQALVVSAVAWASWRATRRIGTWLYPPGELLMADPKDRIPPTVVSPSS
ncbi:MAG TPA: hypothetical protein VKR06_08345 [Ktedonosporobacter sp.]|nr:hypothetical protein [Ktedonosporobacter sp.]